ncbi:Dph6-related ATP pyrophosphatase [Vibrio methylphosphonaticus]|uniref:Dph6-related ATP pyrophosphatase n=1 Tax=Vibrio methylphosphonaticus TaxID=2946866 RepID=UPI0029E7DD3A|nr:ATPase [Vibrio methylphosphonaticus]
MMKNIIISWSSGKDSTLALERLMESDDYHVVGLYTTHVNGEVPFQVTPLSVVEMQANRLGLPLITIELPAIFPSNEIYQSTVIQGIQASGMSIDGIAFGDMFCNGIVDYRKSYVEPAGYEAVFPLLGENSYSLAKEILQRGIETVMVTVDRNVLPESTCGQVYTQELIDNLPKHVDPCGEDGEFHTLVMNSQYFSSSLQLEHCSIETAERFSHLRYRIVSD